MGGPPCLIGSRCSGLRVASSGGLMLLVDELLEAIPTAALQLYNEPLMANKILVQVHFQDIKIC